MQFQFLPAEDSGLQQKELKGCVSSGIAFSMVAVQGIHPAQVLHELGMESPSLVSTCVCSKHQGLVKISLELPSDPCKGELLSKPQLTIIFLNRDSWNQYSER